MQIASLLAHRLLAFSHIQSVSWIVVVIGLNFRDVINGRRIGNVLLVLHVTVLEMVAFIAPKTCDHVPSALVPETIIGAVLFRGICDLIGT